MHCSQMLSLAAVLVERAPSIVQWPLHQSNDAGDTRYCGNSAAMRTWSALQTRITRWSDRVDLFDGSVLCSARSITDLATELFLTEPLSKAWAAIVISQQTEQGLRAIPAIYSRTLYREDDLRDRAAGAVLSGGALSMESSLQLHRLRRTTSRISQMLVEIMGSRFQGVARLAHGQLDQPTSAAPQRHWWQLAARVAVPLRLLAQTLAPATQTECGAASRRLIRKIMQSLPPKILAGVNSPWTATLAGQAACESMWRDAGWPPERKSPRPTSIVSLRRWN